MTLLYDGERCFFRENSYALAESVILHLPFDGTVTVNDQTRITSREGTVIIPGRFLKEGGNTLSLRTGRRTIPAESITVQGSTATPAGFPTRETLAALCRRCRSLETRLAKAEEALAESRADMPTLLFS